MSRAFSAGFWGTFFSAIGLLLPAAPAGADDSAQIKALFADPPRQYSSAPLWVWNDMLSEEQIVATLRDLAGQKVKQAFVHPRPGLMTPYLSADWFRLWKAALAEAERLDMNLWIYDENSYPSGFAGGFVPDAMPESPARTLVLKRQTRVARPGDEVVAVFRMADGRYQDVTRQARAGQTPPGPQYLVASIVRCAATPWYGGKSYVDLLYPGVTQKFLEITLDAYQREIGSQLGNRVPGSFTDEPRLEAQQGVPWTDDLPQAFQKRWGYSLLEQLPCLVEPVGDWKRVRHNFLQLLLELFIERWGRPYHDYCQQHRLEFTGHYWEHDWPNCGLVPDSMAMYAWHQRPAIDCLTNRYQEDTHGQFGNVRIVKELCSAANQLGARRTLCEAYGAGGWDLRFEDMKRIGDWLYVLGVNTLDEHLSFVSIRGARKRDHPQSFSYHEPWWSDYHLMAAYFTRLSLALSHGQQVHHVLLLEPTTTAWMYQYGTDAACRDHLAAIGDKFQQTVLGLSRAQVEYDIGCEDIIARHGTVGGSPASGGRADQSAPCLVVGQRGYDTVILPPLVENLNARTVNLLERYLAAGGTVFCCGPAPALVDGRPTDRCRALGQESGWKQINAAAAAEIALARCRDGFAVRRAEGDRGILFHHRRQLDDGQLLFLVNTSIEHPSEGVVEAAAAGGAERWDPESGAVVAYPFTAEGGGIRAGFALPPCGSLLLFVSRQPLQPAPLEARKTSTIPPVGPPQVRRLEPNVLTIDYLDVTAGGRTLRSAYCCEASKFAFVQSGMDGNPWDSAVQFRDEFISRKFPPQSGFEATYRFTIQGQVPRPLLVVVERPDLYAITCNGAPVAAVSGSWWLDRAFGKIDITSAAKVGENALSIKAGPFSVYHEIEPIYVLSDFTLRPTDAGFVIAPPEALRLDRAGWNRQGHPFYAAGVSYTQSFDVGQLRGRYAVLLPEWYGSVARVIVNGKPAGHVIHQPWQCDVTDRIQPGTNTIEVVVIGTLNSTLGPHHAGAVPGTAWPGLFRQAPTSGPPPGGQYHTIGYGLFQSFVLQHTAE